MPQRVAEPVGDVVGLVRTPFDHYEEAGEIVRRERAQEGGYPALPTQTERGRRSNLSE